MFELLPSSTSRSGRLNAVGEDVGRKRARTPHAPARPLRLPAGSGALLLIAVMALAITLLALLPQAFNDDSWLALVTGRYIWNSGVPHQDTLTVISHGASWVDQQWLAQLASYALYRAGGLGLLGLVNVALMTVSVGIAVMAASRRGARGWIVMAVLAACLMQIIPAREVRTQAFAMPLIVATILLLSGDSRRHTRRVYWCLPILILWANLHGTAVLGAAMVSLRGLMLAAERVRETPGRARGWTRWGGPFALVLGAPLCVLLTPYGFEIVSYYRDTLMNSSFKQLVTEWQPMTSQAAIAVPFFLLAGVSIWSFGRRPKATTSWEKLVLVVLAASSIMVIRNGLLFGFAALVIVPSALDGAIPRTAGRAAPVRHRLNAGLCWTATTVLAVIAASTVLQPSGSLEYHYQRLRLLEVVRAETQRNPSIKVFADVRYADWLLWRDPQLRGRLANDARFELLTGSQMRGIVRVLLAIGPDWKQAATGYRLLVLDRTSSADSVRGFLMEPGRRVLYDDGERVVILRRASQAGLIYHAAA
jgi:hypothetical protein